MSDASQFVDIYTTTWTGIFIGLAIGSAVAFAAQGPRWWGFVYFAVFIGCAVMAHYYMPALMVKP